MHLAFSNRTSTNKISIYQACGILGATVMPHSLYLGSGMVQPRLFDYDLKHGHVASRPTSNSTKPTYRPSISAIKSCLNYSIAELAFALFTFALFVNSAILIVAGASLYGIPGAEGASLFSIYDLLAASIAPAAGTIFALALLLSGISAGIVCTISGQMVSEGALNWAMAPWMRRLITRSISITPSIIIAAAVGKDGLTAALNGSQVALSVALPFISAPLIYFTCRNKFMTVHPGRPTMTDLDDDSDDEDEVVAVAIEANTAAGNVAEATTLSSTATPTSDSRNALNSVASPNNQTLENGQIEEEGVKFRNHWISIIFAIAVWLVITVMNVANLVLLGLGK
jgi:metal iron transporter